MIGRRLQWFARRSRWAWAGLVLLAAYVAVFDAAVRHYTRPPLDVPLNLNADTRIAQAIRLPLAAPYDLSVRLPRPASDAQATALIASKSAAGGAIGVRWRLVQDARVVQQGDAAGAGAPRHTEQGVAVPVARLHLAAGDYTLHAEVDPVPAFAEAPASMRLSLQAGSTDVPVLKLLLWLARSNELVVIVTGLLFISAIGWIAVRCFFRPLP